MAVLSNPRDKEAGSKMKVRPMEQKGELFFQLELFRNNQAFHENVNAKDAVEKLLEAMKNFKQLQMETLTTEITVLISKKGKVTIKKKQSKKVKESVGMSHNRKKNYILEEGIPVPFLVDLGVMTQEGKVVNSRFDKFKQINRFLEFIEDVLPKLPKNREVSILDFGCGKSYLTFAMYYYLHEMKKYDIRIIGLDLKTAVIKNCNALAEKYGYEKLKFLEGNIADYTGTDHVDMVVTLHACDTATDFALAKAVGWGARVILSVPCCQHELNKQMKLQKTGRSKELEPVLKYGILKERMAALFTDELRAQYLEREGYDVQVLEFIDMEHTPKNLLIRAVKTSGKAMSYKNVPAEQSQKEKNAAEAIAACEEYLKVNTTLGSLLGE